MTERMGDKCKRRECVLHADHELPHLLVPSYDCGCDYAPCLHYSEESED